MFPWFREQLGTALDLIVEFSTLGEYRLGADLAPGAPTAPADAPGHAPQLGGAGYPAGRAAGRHTVAGGATGRTPVATPAARRLLSAPEGPAPSGHPVAAGSSSTESSEHRPVPSYTASFSHRPLPSSSASSGRAPSSGPSSGPPLPPGASSGPPLPPGASSGPPPAPSSSASLRPLTVVTDGGDSPRAADRCRGERRRRVGKSHIRSTPASPASALRGVRGADGARSEEQLCFAV
jgi:hypothetical protein